MKNNIFLGTFFDLLEMSAVTVELSESKSTPWQIWIKLHIIDQRYTDHKVSPTSVGFLDLADTVWEAMVHRRWIHRQSQRSHFFL